MIRLRDTRYPHTAALLTGAIKIAEYYGFVPVESVSDKNPDRTARVRVEGEWNFARRDERTILASAKTCIARHHNPNETLLVWRVNHASRERSGMNAAGLELHVIGAPQGMAEALLMIVADAVTAEAGISERILSINSIGSFESSNRFLRDITTFLRKHLESIAPALRSRAATDPLGTLIQLFEKGHPATPRAPQAMEYLTDEERQRLWELLEYLEVLGVPYELNPGILGSRDMWSHTLFEISAIDRETGARIPVALGGRYDPMASRLAARPTSASMVTLHAEMRGRTQVHAEERPRPSLYFAHLGPEARRRSFSVLEILRKNNIPIHQSLMHHRLGDQMERAKRTSVSHLLIMGHKEAVEGTVLVREVATNSQEAVSLADLPSYLRRTRAVAMA